MYFKMKISVKALMDCVKVLGWTCVKGQIICVRLSGWTSVEVQVGFSGNLKRILLETGVIHLV